MGQETAVLEALVSSPEVINLASVPRRDSSYSPAFNNLLSRIRINFEKPSAVLAVIDTVLIKYFAIADQTSASRSAAYSVLETLSDDLNDGVVSNLPQLKFYLNQRFSRALKQQGKQYSLNRWRWSKVNPKYRPKTSKR